MERVNNKERLLKLMEILREYTDEEHELSYEELMDRFRLSYGPGMKVNKISLKDDIDHLIASGFDVTINQEKEGLPKYYSHQYRLFELYELRMLIDAVVSARFITKNETRNLIRKIKKLTSIHQAKLLQNELLIDSSVKSESPMVRLAIHVLHQAVAEKKVIAFQYGRYNVDKEFTLSRNGGKYLVKPLALTWTNDFYYLIACFMEADEIRHYRIDRIRNVEVTTESFKYDPFDVSRYVQSTFHMFAGSEQWIKICFRNELINVMLDKFGKEVDIQKDGESHFILTTKARDSAGLASWILNWGSQAKVISPPSLVEKIKSEIASMHELYN
ncbi:helix-turn-helix transcriptional regulator [Bacillus salacetis]|uniref:helix-turn-helix transcriptional regulator n=1 Tax=Bacillus salacetis TaxID=2315464 RepID=UPI001F0BBFAB|nr:WYL domain-containing protein [Bacillus salacetis]